ncbi:MAG: thioredoxin family protein [Prevotellaceae bacterium]|nr:thioredoxin family protein [Prevotellaceae bacterium]
MKKYFFLLCFMLYGALLPAQQPAASWKVTAQAGTDGEVDLLFTVTVSPGWYIYSTDVLNGPVPTSVSFAAGAGFEPVGALKELDKSKGKYDEGFGIKVKIFEGTARFSQKIRLNTDKAFLLKGTVVYQSCNGASCTYEEEEFQVQIDGVASAAPDDAIAITEKEESEGLWMFLLLAFATGLGAIFTPCVFPMIPMTVSFFISGNQKSGATRGLVFGVSVTAIYVLVGVLAAVFKSADAADVLSSHWIPNLIFAVLFLVFALSFFGAFEITLPTGLANKADSKADRGGAFGAFFVAFALVVVSFSCTGPFVGSILVEAMSHGIALKPVLGMLVFGLAFSLPFVVFSLFPSWIKKMPKSGGWLNMVKVVFAFVLLALSLKYFAVVNGYFGWEILSREVFIAIWMVCALLLGLYFLGRLRLAHDSAMEHVGVGRLLFAIASFTFALYLLPGLFGAPLPALSGIVPDPKGASVFAPQGENTVDAAYGQGLCGKAKYSSPAHRLPYGLPAYHDIDEAVACAKQQNKPVLLVFKFNNCSVCKSMEGKVWSNEQVLELLRSNVVIASLYVDDKTELPQDEWITSAIDGKVKKTLGRKLRDIQMSRFGVSAQPYYVLIGHDEAVLTAPVAESSVEEFLYFLRAGLEKFNSGQNAAFTPMIKL